MINQGSTIPQTVRSSDRRGDCSGTCYLPNECAVGRPTGAKVREAKLARRRIFSDVVIAALIAFAASAPVAFVTAYWNHTEAVLRLENEQVKQSKEAEIVERRTVAENRQAMCAAALIYLEDETPNARLTADQSQRLLEDMRRTASSCATPTTDSRTPR